MSDKLFKHEELEEFLIHAFQSVFTTMMSQDIKHLNASYFPNEANSKPPAPVLATSGDIITASVGFTGVVQGVIYIAVNQDLGNKLTSAFLGMELAEVEAEGDETVNDALGELANMCVGVFKNRISDRGYHCMLTLPSLVRGNNIAIQSNIHQGIIRQVHDFRACGMQLVVDLIFRSD